MFRFILAPNDLKDIRNGGLAYFALLWNVEVYQFSYIAFYKKVETSVFSSLLES